jgi:hypothetical protein
MSKRDMRDFFIDECLVRPCEDFGYNISYPKGGMQFRETLKEVKALCGDDPMRFLEESNQEVCSNCVAVKYIDYACGVCSADQCDGSVSYHDEIRGGQ